MQLTFTQTVMVASIATFLAVFTAAGLLYTKTESSPSVTRHVAEIGTKVKDRTSDPVEEIYRQSGLANFAQKYPEELTVARKDRKRECGTLISVSKIDCEICDLLVTGLRSLAQRGSTQDDVVHFATKACIDLKIEDARICPAIVQEFKVNLNIIFKPLFFLCSCLTV